jgi:hypothetical protein
LLWKYNSNWLQPVHEAADGVQDENDVSDDVIDDEVLSEGEELYEGEPHLGDNSDGSANMNWGLRRTNFMLYIYIVLLLLFLFSSKTEHNDW